LLANVSRALRNIASTVAGAVGRPLRKLRRRFEPPSVETRDEMIIREELQRLPQPISGYDWLGMLARESHDLGSSQELEAAVASLYPEAHIFKRWPVYSLSCTRVEMVTLRGPEERYRDVYFYYS
jgi:hypothetical protein